MFWKIDSKDPSLFELPNAMEWLLVNPLLYDQLSLFLSAYRGSFHQFAPSKYFGYTTGIVLATRNDQAIQSAEAEGYSSLAKICVELLARLRHAAGQATVPSGDHTVMAWTITKIDEVPVFEPPSGYSLEGPKTRVQEYWWRTAITAQHIGTAVMPGVDFVPPAHEMLFLDAAAAHRANDYRKAILYAATSTEVAFGSVIDREYERVLAARSDERFRIIARPQAGGAPTIYKDPVYERLRSRPDFRVLIHELAFYVLRRSLLAENEALYLKAIRLYLTRNKLAHAGVLNEGETQQTYPLDNIGSSAALRTSLELFSWLGERADFPLPMVGLVVPESTGQKASE
jgi:hypothetical protein